MKQNKHLFKLGLVAAMTAGLAGFSFGQGVVDTTFQALPIGAPLNPGQNLFVRTVVAQPDGGVMVSGGFQTPVAHLIRLTPAGLRDSTFNFFTPVMPTTDSGLLAGLISVSSTLDDRYLLAGYMGDTNSPSYARVSKRGAFDGFYGYSMDSGRFVTPTAIKPYANDSVLVFGLFETVGPYTISGITRAGITGLIDPAFAPRFSNVSYGFGYGNWVHTAAALPDGKVVVGGVFTTVGTTPRGRMVRLLATGAIDTSFADPNFDDEVWAITVQPDGKYLVGGSFTGGIKRLNSNGTVDASFVPSSTTSCWSICLRADGKITSLGGTGIRIWNADGSAVPGYTPPTLDNVAYAASITHEGKLYLGGNFSTADGQSYPGVVRVAQEVAGSQSLSLPNPEGSAIQWIRTGSVPEIDNCQFELSLNGTTFTKIAGTPVRISNGWELTNITPRLPGGVNFTIRARGLATTGYHNASTSLMESKSIFNRPKPVFTTQPASVSVILADPVGPTLSVAVTSAAAVTYQWRKNNANIAGATSSSYTLPGPITATSAGSYTVVVTSSAGVVASAAALVSVITPIAITTQPVALTVGQGKAATFKVVATGTAPLYRWQKDGVDIPGVGASKSIFTIAISAPGDEAAYRCVVSNFAGPVTSNAAALTVINYPTANPTPNLLLVKGLPAATPIDSQAVGEGTLSYVWLQNLKPIVGQTGSTLTLTNVTPLHAGKYGVKVTNLASTFTSPIVEVGVVDTAPTAVKVLPVGATAVFIAPSYGNLLTHVWKTAAGNVSVLPPRVTTTLGGAKTLTIKALTAADAGDYFATVSGPGGTQDTGIQKLIVTTARPEIALSNDLPAGMTGAPYSYTVTMNDDVVVANDDNQRTPTSFKPVGLPPGLSMSAAGIISGTPTAGILVPTTYNVTITASNAQGPSVVFTDTLTVNPIPSTMVGNWVGLIARDSGLAGNHGGKVEITVSSLGSYSGFLTLGSLRYPFAKGDLQITNAANSTNTIVISRGTAATSPPPVTLSFNMSDTANTLTGSITVGAVTCTVDGWRHKWKTTSTSPLPATDYIGKYNTALTPPALPVPGQYDHPMGDSILQCNVVPAGTFTGTLLMADGVSKGTWSGFVGPNGELLVYQGFGATGSVHGKLVITPIGTTPTWTDSSVTGQGNVTWFRLPAVTRNYNSGFGPLNLTVTGYKYATPATGTNLIGSDVATNDVRLTFTEGAEVNTNPNTDFKIAGASAAGVSVVTMQSLASGQNPASVALGVVSTTGAFSGSFKQPLAPARVAAFSGVVIRQGTGPGVGYGFFNLARLTLTVTTSPLVSGKVSMVNVP
jgi:uncharacterized delta-60 repeat protein